MIVALDAVELDRCGSFRRCHVRRFDRPENLALGAQQNDAPSAAHALGELGGGVLRGAAAGWHGRKIDAA